MTYKQSNIRLKRFSLLTLVVMVAACSGGKMTEPNVDIGPCENPAPLVIPRAEPAELIPDRYIVVFKDSVIDAAEAAARLAAAHGFTPSSTWVHPGALIGFAATLSDEQVEALRCEVAVSYISQQVRVQVP